jgi:DNA-binding Xre family transcriptional regulator
LKADQLYSGLQKSAQKVQDFGKNIASAAANATAAFAVAGTAAATGFGLGLAAITKHAADNITEVTKLADNYGIATEKLAGLKLAADVTGVGMETLEKSFAHLAKSIGEGTVKNSEMADAFQSLGLSAEDLSKGPLDESFKAVIDKIGAIQNPIDRATAAFRIFGEKAAEKLLPIINQGSAGLDRFQAIAEKIGLSFSRIDAQQVKQAKESVTSRRCRLIITVQTAHTLPGRCVRRSPALTP